MSGVLGSISSWASVVVAGFALLFAYRSSVSSRKSADAAHEQIRHRDERDEQEQASKVAAWLKVEQDEEGRPRIYAEYINSSNLPVFRLTFVLPAIPYTRMGMEVVPPTKNPEVLYLESMTQIAWGLFDDLLNADPDFEFDTAEATANAFAQTAVRINEERVAIWFRDTRNVVWRRDADGILGKAKVDANGNIGDLDYQLKPLKEWLFRPNPKDGSPA